MSSNNTSRILVVDDEEVIRLALRKFLRSRGYEVDVAPNGPAALELLGTERYALMLSDVRMPEMSGIELVPLARQKDEDLAIIMLTAVNDAPTATEAFSQGALDYMMKPVELSELEVALERAIAKRGEGIEKRRIEALIREEVKLRTAELEQEKEALRLLTVSIPQTLINAMEAKDEYLRGHSSRVAEMAANVARQMGLDENTVSDLHLAGRLHDVGKIGIREEVLHKPAKLTEDEFDHVKTHVKIGCDILDPLPHLKRVRQFVADHHEHIDGSGYPVGTRGEEISMGGRILTVCDSFDALTSRRPYRDPLTPEGALDFMRNDVGRLFDPKAYEALREVIMGPVYQ
jgi:putative two-component system response regulator